MVDESVLTDEVRALEGQTAPPVSVRITPSLVRRARETLAGQGGSMPAEGDEAPGYILAALEPEAVGVRVPDLLPTSLLVSNEWWFARPLRVGEELEAQGRIDSIAERFGGRVGYSVHVRTATDFRAGGEVVARSTRTLAFYDPASSSMAEDE